MTRYRITAPVKGVNSLVAGMRLVDSVCEVGGDAYGALAYFRRQGYSVEEIIESPVVVEDLPVPDDDEVKKPGKSASKADWVAYALTQDVPAEEAEALTRDQLADALGGAE